MISPDNLGEYNKKFGRQAGNGIVKGVVEEFLRRMEAALDQAKQMGGDRPVDDPQVEF